MAERVIDEIKNILPAFVKSITSSPDAYRVSAEAGFKVEYLEVLSAHYTNAVRYILEQRNFSENAVESFLLQVGATDELNAYRASTPLPVNDIPEFVQLLINYFVQFKLEYFRQKLNGLLAPSSVLDIRERIKDFYGEFNRFVVSTLAGSYNEGILYAEDFVRQGVIQLREDLSSDITFYTTGLPTLDAKLVEGFAPGKLTILAGRPGSGKSIVVTNIFTNLVQLGTHVLFFNNEMDSKSIFRRVVSILGTIDYRYLTKDLPLLKDDQNLQQQISTAIALLKENKHFVVVDRTDLSLSDIYIEVYNYKEKYNPKHLVVIVDLVNRLADVRRDLSNRAAIFEDVAYELKSLARNLDIHVLACAQLRRKNLHTKRSMSNLNSLRPTMDEVKNSGGFEEAADLLLLLFRPKLYVNLDELGKDYLEIHIEKQRQGLIDPLPAVFEVLRNVPKIVPSELTPDLQDSALDGFDVGEVF